MGSLDEKSLQSLSLIIQLNNQMQISDENIKFFPSFFWVIRDFSLQLKDEQGEEITPNEYLENALTQQKGFTNEIEKKNHIRRLIKEYFKERECVTMVRPVVSEESLQRL